MHGETTDAAETRPACAATPALVPAALAPVAPSERLLLLDVLRGVALFGIFMVNMPLFALPMMEAFGGPWLVGAPSRDRIGWWIVTVGFQYKFISMYSMLFGVGFAMQLSRAEARGRDVTRTYARRLVTLTAIGVVHAFVIWYGDVLIAYSLLGWPLLLLGRLSARWLVWLGIGVVLFASIMEGSLGAMQAAAVQFEPRRDSVLATAAPDVAMERVQLGMLGTLGMVAGPELGELGEAGDPDALRGVAPSAEPPGGWRAIEQANDPFDPRWSDAETRAFRDGPFRDALAFRLALWCGAIVYGLFGWLWHVFGLFLLGAGLLKAGFFAPIGARWRRRCLVLLPIGLVAEWLCALAHARAGWDATILTGALDGLHGTTAAALMFGYVGLVSTLVELFPRAALWPIIGNAGRMGLTCYLAESTIATFIMYWWGLAWFGQVDLLTQCQLVVAIWASLVVLANVWFRFFRIGPVEWVWRSASYGSIQRLRA